MGVACPSLLATQSFPCVIPLGSEPDALTLATPKTLVAIFREEGTDYETMGKVYMAICLGCLEHLDRITNHIELFSPQPGWYTNTRAYWVDNFDSLGGLAGCPSLLFVRRAECQREGAIFRLQSWLTAESTPLSDIRNI